MNETGTAASAKSVAERSSRVEGRSFDRGATKLIAFALCFLAAVAEGIDLLSAGLAAPMFGPEFQLSSSQMGWVFSSATLGLFIGAALGGWAADRVGRKWMLTVSMLFLGVFSLGTAFAPDVTVLYWMRFLAGIGLGGALPNLISMASEIGSPKRRATNVTIMTAGMPVGSALLAGIILLAPDDMNWRVIFYIGGGWPLVLVPLMIFFLPESPEYLESRRARRPEHSPRLSISLKRVIEQLFADRTAVTLLLWAAFFFTLISTYFLMNWLPSLLVGAGFSPNDATFGSMVYSIGSVVGAMLIGYLFDHGPKRFVLIGVYTGVCISLFGLGTAGQLWWPMMIAIFLAGFFVVASQFLLYGIAAACYPASVRGAGVGSSVAVGRLGSVVGPLLGGVLLSAGHTSSEVLLAILSAMAIVFVAVMLLTARAFSNEGG